MSKQKNEEQMNLDDYDPNTGEVKNVKAFQKPIFRSMWCNP